MPKNVPVSFAKYADPLLVLFRGSILSLFFLTPLVFAPFTTEALEMNKQVVFVILGALAATGFLGACVMGRRIDIRGGWLINLVPLIFLVVIFTSAIFSVAGMESWLGYGGQEYVSLLTAAVGVMLFYVLVNGSDAQLARQSLLALLAASSLVGLLVLPSIFNLHLLPFEFTHIIGFNTVGNINSLAAWLIPVALIGLGFLLVDTNDKNSLIPGGASGVLFRLLISFVLLVTLILLVAIDFWALWMAFMVGLVALVILSFLEPSHFSNRQRLAIPVGLFMLAIVFLFINSPFKITNFPVVVSPSLSASWDIAKQTLHQDVKSLLIGSGPGSFDLDYAKYRPTNVNETIFWNTRFDRAQIHPLTVLTTNGILGLASWLVFILVVIALGLGRIVRGRQEVEWRVNYALLAGWLSVFCLQLLSASNMALTILFWGLSGLLVAEAVKGTKHFEFDRAPRTALAVTGGFALVILAGCLTTFALVSRHTAEIAFAKAVRLEAKGASADELVAQMSKAVSRYAANAVYQRNLATAYLAQASGVISRAVEDENFSDDEQRQLAGVADASVSAANKAISLGGDDGVNWAVNGLIYRELMPFLHDAQNYAASMYAKAIELEPNNPAFYTDLGRVYLAVADRAQEVQQLDDVTEEVKAVAVTNEQETLKVATQHLEKAIGLKSDYAAAHYYLAAAYERQGNLQAAAERLQALTQVQPQDVGLGFQLAVIYLKMDKPTEAETELERVLVIYPQYSNAMWYLAAIKANAGENDAALALLKRIETLNPGNSVVKESIVNLEAGQIPSVDPEPIDLETPLEGAETLDEVIPVILE